MAGETYTTNMNLVLPGPGLTDGPQYALDLNSSLTIIDSHDHSSGSGVQITPDGLNISSDLTISANNLTSVRSLRFASQVSPLALAADIGCLYESGVDLYYNDGSGNQIRLTQSGGLAGTPGSIGGLSSPASVNYSAGSSTYVFQSAANTAGNIDCQDIILRNATASSKGLTLFPPAAMASDLSITLPALPASQKIMTLDNTGAMSAPYSFDGTTITTTANVINVITTPDGAVTQPKLYTRTVANSASAGNVSISNLAGNTDNNTTTTYASVTPSQTLVCTGRPVLGFFGGPPSAGGILHLRVSTGNAFNVRVLRDGSATVYEAEFGQTGGNIEMAPPFFMDQPSAGSHTYILQIKLISTPATCEIQNLALWVYEI